MNIIAASIAARMTTKEAESRRQLTLINPQATKLKELINLEIKSSAADGKSTAEVSINGFDDNVIEAVLWVLEVNMYKVHIHPRESMLIQWTHKC